MAHTALATLEPAPECRWRRPLPHAGAAAEGHQLPHAPSPPFWTCVHGTPHLIHEDECRTCASFEPVEGTEDRLERPAGEAVPREAAAPVSGSLRGLRAIARGAIVLTAVLFLALGITVLSSPWAIPVTVAFWLSGAALGAFGLFGPLPDA